MVFSSLSSHEKDAFFALLDEYFASRPELLASLGSSEGGNEGLEAGASSPAASAVHRALASNPEATSKLVSAGLKHGVPKSSPYATAASDPEINNAVGRVAAASLAFSSKQPPPPAAPRTPSTSGGSKGLSSSRKFGDVDASSPKAMFGSLKNSTAQKSAPPPPAASVPPAFGAKKNPFAPPPVRRAASTTSAPVEPEEEPQEEEQEHGEWAEALYDYSGDDATDLRILAGQRILVTERTSNDWWTGEVDDKRGLFPAAYVKIL